MGRADQKITPSLRAGHISQARKEGGEMGKRRCEFARGGIVEGERGVT